MRAGGPQGCILALASVLASGCATSHLLSTQEGLPPSPGAAPHVVAVSPSPLQGSAPIDRPSRPGVAGTSARTAVPGPAPRVSDGPTGGAPSGFAPLTGSWTKPRAGFGRMLVDDTVSVLTSPLRWDRHDWLKLSLATAGVAAMMPFDEAIAHRAHGLRGPGEDRAASALQQLGAGGAFAVVGGFYLAGVAFHDQRAKEVAADGLISSIIAGGIITPLIKQVSGRHRPRERGGEEDLFTPGSGAASFPSGHTTEAFAVAAVVARHYDQTWIKALSYSLAGVVGLARIEQDAHFASDVLAGALVGTAVGQAVVHLDDERRHQDHRFTFSAGPLFSREGPGVAFHLSF